MRSLDDKLSESKYLVSAKVYWGHEDYLITIPEIEWDPSKERIGIGVSIDERGKIGSVIALSNVNDKLIPVKIKAGMYSGPVYVLLLEKNSDVYKVSGCFTKDNGKSICIEDVLLSEGDRVSFHGERFLIWEKIKMEYKDRNGNVQAIQKSYRDKGLFLSLKPPKAGISYHEGEIQIDYSREGSKYAAPLFAIFLNPR